MHQIKKAFFGMFVILCFVNMQCETEGAPSGDNVCDQTTLVNKTLYNNLVSANFTIVNAEIADDCLTIEISASGCDGNSWGFKLVDSGLIAESSPEQRYLKFQLTNEEACLAVFKRTASFNLTPLQINGSHEIVLHLEGLQSSLNYKY